MLLLFYLSSGLFLGWSLGANDASNIFGTAVGTRMIRFRTAALVASICVILGATMSGFGTTETLGRLGSVNMIAGAFMVALSAAVSIFIMTRAGVPVSTSQAIVGAIVGWNFFAGKLTDYDALIKIALSWLAGPVLAAIFAIIIFWVLKKITRHLNLHMFRLDAYTRIGLLVIGAFGAYSLGANNIANVMGVFVPLQPLGSLTIGSFSLSGTQQLFILGGLAIALGIYTYSYKVMMTVGSGIVKLKPQSALVVVLSQAIVLFLFASRGLKATLESAGLPSFPLVPISSSQVVLGAVVGIGLMSGHSGINHKVLGKIFASWIVTPIIAALIGFVALFFLQNVFDQEVYQPETYSLNPAIIKTLDEEGIHLDETRFKTEYPNPLQFNRDLKRYGDFSEDERELIMEMTRIQSESD